MARRSCSVVVDRLDVAWHGRWWAEVFVPVPEGDEFCVLSSRDG